MFLRKRTQKSTMRINALPAIAIIGLLLLGTQKNAAAQSTQSFTLSEAINTGLKNYQSIQAKRSYLNASTALVQNTRNEYLPNVIASVQQDFGNINGQYGPLAAIGGVAGVSSSGPISSSQNWNSSFGGVYFLNTNWEVYSFGRLRSKINLYVSQV